MNIENGIFKQLAENNWDPIVFANLEGEVVYANPAAYKLYGYENGELIGQNVDIFNSKLTHDTSHIVQSIIEHGGWSGEILQRKKNNEHFDALLTVSLIFGENNEPVGYASNSKDISDRVKANNNLRTALKDKEILFQEIHHRLKNNLAIISSILELQAEKSTIPLFVDAIRDSQRRIKATALAHEILYENETLEGAGLNDYVENLSNNVFNSFVEDNSRIQLSRKVEIESLDIDHAIPLGLIINELMTNSFKHAFPSSRAGAIDIHVLQNDGIINLNFADDGIGLPEGFDIRTSGSTGMLVMNSLVDQLEGTMTCDSTKGTRFTINFKSN